mmetsp:Transcript_10032/g.28952  ORF Transcript_10032/g.28952 Transcript_10032/m.28952 type:complete len:277 (-) Transcript_10032:1799-2629(-)
MGVDATTSQPGAQQQAAKPTSDNGHVHMRRQWLCRSQQGPRHAHRRWPQHHVLQRRPTRLLYLLACGWCGQFKMAREASIDPGAADGLLDGDEDGCAAEEGRLAHRLAAREALGMGGLLQQTHAHVSWDIAGEWWFVFPRAVGEEAAGRLVDDHLLARVEADAHDQRALSLPDVNQRIQTLAAVVEHLAVVDAPLPCQHVDLHLTHGRAIGVVELKRLAAEGLVLALLLQAHLGPISCRDDLSPPVRHTRVTRFAEGHEFVHELGGRVVDGPAHPL